MKILNRFNFITLKFFKLCSDIYCQKIVQKLGPENVQLYVQRLILLKSTFMFVGIDLKVELS